MLRQKLWQGDCIKMKYFLYDENTKMMSISDNFIKGFSEIDHEPNFEYEVLDSLTKKITINTEKKKNYLLNKAIEKIKSEAGKQIESSTFEHNGIIFSCGLTSQINYMGLLSSVNSGVVELPTKNWGINGEENIIEDMEDLNSIISKLFSVVYPIRKKANDDERIARNSTIEQLEAMISG